MRLYHGTNEQCARKALKEGLKPRHMTAKGNWKHTVSSRADAVYLTTVYAPYFGLCATDKGRLAVIELETDLLDQSKLNPDEDFLEQATRGHDNVKGSMNKRTEYYKKHAKDYADKWELSVKHMGTCCYAGVIPPEATTRVVFWDAKSNGSVAGCFLDPSICIANYKFCSQKYAALTRWVFGEKITPNEYIGFELPPEASSMYDAKAIEEMLSKWEGEVIECAGYAVR